MNQVTRAAVLGWCMVAGGCALAACAHRAEVSAPPASAPPPAAPVAQQEARATGVGANAPVAEAPEGHPPPAAPAPASAQAPPEAEANAPRDRAASRANRPGSNELDRAEREIATGDCATACRALGSMERAVGLLCARSSSDDDGGRCVDAKARLASSRRRVRTSCGTCANGTSVDPDAPIPSRP